MAEKGLAGAIFQPDAASYLEEAAHGRLTLMKCEACGETHFYPRRVCPFCSSINVKPITSSGNGTIYSFTVLRRGPGSPSVPAYVSLIEGPTVLARIIDADPDTVQIGMQVSACFTPDGFDGTPLLSFRPA